MVGRGEWAEARLGLGPILKLSGNGVALRESRPFDITKMTRRYAISPFPPTVRQSINYPSYHFITLSLCGGGVSNV